MNLKPGTVNLRLLITATRRRWFAQVALRTIGRAAAAAAVPALAALLVERLLGLAGLPLVLLAAITIAVSLGAAGAVAWRVKRRPDDRHVARFIEERAAGLPDVGPLDDELVSAIEAQEGVGPASFRPLLVKAAMRRVEGISPDRIVTREAIGRAALQAAGGAALLLLAVILARGPLVHAVVTAWVGLFPGSLHLDVVPGDARVLAGQPLRLRAIVRSGGRTLTHFAPTLTVAAGGEQRTVTMAPDGDGFAFPFESVDRTFRYRIAAGAARSREHTITALFPPRVRRIDLRYEYPAFTGLKARDEEDGGDIYAPGGTRVRLRIHTDKPVIAGRLAFVGAPAAGLRAAGDRLLEAELVLSRDDSYRVSLADADGLESRGDTEYFIRLMDDRPPDVRILRPAGDQQITPLEEVAIEARADDDHGISSFELVYATSGGEPRTVPFGRVADTGVARTGSYLLAVEALDVQPGDVISYYARARDIGRGKRSTEVKSDIFFLEVRPFTEEFTAAQSQAGAGASDPQLEALIAAQKEIINATWNLDRRSRAGTSASDLEAVAQAQAELKAKAEQMVGRVRRDRLPMREPRQVAPPRQGRGGRGGADAVASAIEAMGRAADELQRKRTAGALPHEMAALHALLQAQAEITRRQVMQQQAAAGAGGVGRQGQDLSALFDKELQRQQRTNYETRSQIEERPDQQTDDSALERIRDLARRQEDLSRRQRELAEANLAQEERKRQLEKLMREQTELREQAEALARQMAQQEQSRGGSPSPNEPKPGASGQPEAQTAAGGERTGQSDAARSRVRDASEQMRSAAGDLQRDDAGAAAESAARAAERLRAVEQQMRGDSPDAQRRAAGELQLEAQQIADEQRRIAAEAGRLDRGADAANADARRRLAGEKDRLADRVDALHRGAAQLAAEPRSGAQGSASAAARAGEAARELERQQIGRRMRETAKQMRDRASASGERGGAAETPSGRAAEGEQQIARALDKIVEQLGGGRGEGRNLSAELGETRDIRDRLDRLEQRVREAEGRERQARAGRGPTQAGEEGRQGERGRQGTGGAGQGGELQKLREEYARELQRARSAIERLQRGSSRDSLGGATPEQHEWSQADPGTEAFKQDFAGWESLRKDVDLAIERHEAAISSQMAKKTAEDRLSAGGSDRAPDAYRRLIAKYYESLASEKVKPR